MMRKYWLVLVKDKKNGKSTLCLERHRVKAEEYIELMEALGREANLFYYNLYSKSYEEVMT